MVSDRIKNLTPSATVELTSKVADMRAAGIDVIAYNVGEPDFNTPDNIIKACEKAMEEGKTKYTPASGIIPLRKAICKKLEKDNNVHYEMNQICVSTGAKQALNNAVLAIRTRVCARKYESCRQACSFRSTRTRNAGPQAAGRHAGPLQADVRPQACGPRDRPPNAKPKGSQCTEF